MRALLLTPVAAPGGAERALAGLARHLPGLGVDVEAVCLEAGPATGWLASTGCPVHVLPGVRLRDVPRVITTVRRVRDLVEGGRFDVVLSNQAKGHVVGGLAARRSGVPAVHWCHVIPGRDAMNRVAARVRAAAVVCTTDGAAAAQRRLTPRTPVRVVRPGIDVAAVAAHRGRGMEVRRALGWGDAPVVGIVGRLQPWKGQAEFLRAAALVAETLPDTRFAVIGGAVLGTEGDYPDRLVCLAAHLGLGHRIHFAGHQADVYPWIDALDVLVHASVLPEPFGLTLLEAMALHKPVVATAAGGPLEIVEDGRSGLLVAPADPASMADAVQRLLASPDLIRSLTTAGGQRAGAFDERRTAEAMHAVLAVVAGDRRADVSS